MLSKLAYKKVSWHKREISSYGNYMYQISNSNMAQNQRECQGKFRKNQVKIMWIQSTTYTSKDASITWQTTKIMGHKTWKKFTFIGQ